jgi:phenylacetyl-CoA:acceptor oxidoreductase subunit 2
VNWLQRHWDARAALNFMLGGAGSGLLAAGALASVPGKAIVLAALALIALGLGAVWLEIGRKLRAAHVFLNPFTSWMTRESFAAAVLFVLGLLFVLLSNRVFLYGAALSAASFLWCQARILRASKGIPSWRAPEVVPLIVFTGLAEGAGLGLFFSAEDAMLALFALAVVARLIAWRRYGAAVKSAALASAGKAMAWIGTSLALLLAFAAYFVEGIAPLAGIAALAGGWRLKFALVTRASFNQGYSLPRLPVRGAR